MFCDLSRSPVEPNSIHPTKLSAIHFQTTTSAKWILCGEHAVVRGHAALVFPLDAQKLSFMVRENTDHLAIEVDYVPGNTAQMAQLVQKVLEHGIQFVGKSPRDLQANIHIQSTIPPGLGLGSSASLCVAIARWFASKGWIVATDMLAFARELEHLFHGHSSGLDIAGVNASSAIYFKQGEVTPVKMAWQPNWRLTACGEVGKTASCIDQVNLLWDKNPQIARDLDDKMDQSVNLARQALEQDPSPAAIEQLKQAMEQGSACFKAWGLITPTLAKHMQDLLEQGALAVKPSGSGGGGMVVSLWKSPA